MPKMLKFVDLKRETPEKIGSKNRKENFLEIYKEFIDTKAKENVYINRYSNYDYMGWYYPYYSYGSGTYKPFTKVVGLLYIDIVDSKTGKLIWQGSGSGSLSANKLTRDQLISNFVFRVMESYPPVDN